MPILTASNLVLLIILSCVKPFYLGNKQVFIFFHRGQMLIEDITSHPSIL